MDLTVIGGDMRQVKLAEMLMRDGHRVRCFALERAESRVLVHSPGLREAVRGAEYVVLPLPALRGEHINAPLSDVRLTPEEAVAAMEPGQVLLGGKLEGSVLGPAAARGVRAEDYLLREELAVRNAAATAEGAVQLLMQELPVTLLGARVLVIGFGRIGKLLSLRLRALGARVVVSARSFSDFAWIESLGMEHADTGRLAGSLGGFTAVVNTVPARILTEELLAQLDEGSLCLDLASKPGGIDMEAAGRLGVRVIWALSLPGRVAPVTSGASILEAIYNIIEESIVTGRKCRYTND